MADQDDPNSLYIYLFLDLEADLPADSLLLFEIFGIKNPSETLGKNLLKLNENNNFFLVKIAIFILRTTSTLDLEEIMTSSPNFVHILYDFTYELDGTIEIVPEITPYHVDGLYHMPLVFEVTLNDFILPNFVITLKLSESIKESNNNNADLKVFAQVENLETDVYYLDVVTYISLDDDYEDEATASSNGRILQEENSTTNDTITNDTSTNDTNTDNTSTNDTSTNETSINDTTTNDTSTNDTNTDNTTTNDTSTNDTNTDDTTTNDTSNNDTNTDDTTTNDTSTNDTNTDDTNTNTDDTNTGDTSTDETSTDVFTDETDTSSTSTSTSTDLISSEGDSEEEISKALAEKIYLKPIVQDFFSGSDMVTLTIAQPSLSQRKIKVGYYLFVLPAASHDIEVNMTISVRDDILISRTAIFTYLAAKTGNL